AAWNGVNWLFAPVNKKRPWPGDLWGVSANGDLLIVETKRAGSGGVDPFADFVGFDRARDARVNGRRVVVAATLREQWQDLLQGERAFIQQCHTALCQGQWRREVWRGVVPYSLKRVVVWRWRELYLREIALRISNEEYEDEVDQALTRRARAGNP